MIDFFSGMFTAANEAQHGGQLNSSVASTDSSSDILHFWRDKSVVWRFRYTLLLHVCYPAELRRSGSNSTSDVPENLILAFHISHFS